MAKAVYLKLFRVFGDYILSKAYRAVAVPLGYKSPKQLARNNQITDIVIHIAAVRRLVLKLCYSAVLPENGIKRFAVIYGRRPVTVNKSYVGSLFGMVFNRRAYIHVCNRICPAKNNLLRLAAVYIIDGSVKRVYRTVITPDAACKIRRQQVKPAVFAVKIPVHPVAHMVHKRTVIFFCDYSYA